MEKFSLFDRYRVELHWDKAIYNRDGVCDLTNATCKGPAVAEALKLNDEDHILVDFFSQYIKLVKSVYVAELKWKGVRYNPDGSISLLTATISHDKELNKVPKLNDDDYLVIDTSGHDIENHPYNLVYKTYVVNSDTNLYKF